MSWPKTNIDPAAVGRVYTHITFEGEGERIFDQELMLEVGNLLVLHRPDGDKHFAVTDAHKVVVDSPRKVGDLALYSTFVLFIVCEAIPEPMREDDAPLSHPAAKVRKTKERP